MKTSLVITILNEEQTIESLIQSIEQQTKIPGEIIIVDGGSTDATVRVVRNFIQENKKLEEPIRLYQKSGNRSIGRNYGVEQAKEDIILFTDAGCTLDKIWASEITKPFGEKSVDVVAGFYKAKAENNFQKALIPYVLVMPDRVDSKTFLPATRSMAIRKKVFEDVGGFNEKLSHNEDYEFANRLKTKNKKIKFVREAIVYWIPRSNLPETFAMFSRFAYGDIESGNIRPKVAAMFGRYILTFVLLLVAVAFHSIFLFLVLIISLMLYIYWSIWKNYKYVKNASAIFYLPLLQFLSDAAVLYGSSKALLKKHG